MRDVNIQGVRKLGGRHQEKIFWLAEVVVPRELFRLILERIGRLREPDVGWASSG